MLIARSYRQVGSQTVKKNPRLNGSLYIAWKLRHHAGDKSGKQIPASAFCHTRITGRVY
jgi:hypothetical protein